MQQQGELMQKMAAQLQQSEVDRAGLLDRLNTQEQRLQAMALGSAATAQAQSSTPQVDAILQALQRQGDAISKLLQKPDRRPTLIDTRGLGKPGNFTGQQDKWLSWSTKTRNYVLGVFPELRPVLEWAEEKAGEISSDDIDESFGELADDSDTIPGVADLDGQLYTVLTQLTEGEPFDITRNCGEGHGYEAWRRLARRYDPSTGGRKKNLLNQILRVPRSDLKSLSRDIERWEDQVRNYERRKGADGSRLQLQDDIKCAALEGMCPESLEQHIQMNSHRLLTYSAVRQEVASYLETKIGTQLGQSSDQSGGGGGGRGRRGENDMDMSSLRATGGGKNSGGKGGGKSGSGKPTGKARFEGECNNCHKKGHKAADCWAPGGGAAKSKDDSKGGGKNKGKKDRKGGGKGKKGLRSLEEGWTEQAEPEQEGMGALELCALEAELSAATLKASWLTQGMVKDGKQLQCITCNLDTGAAISAFPWILAEGRETTPPNGNQYKTASAECIDDQGGLCLKAYDDLEQYREVNGRLAPVHKPLVAAVAAARTQDIWLGNDGGYLVPRNGAIGKAMRAHFEELVQKHGKKGLTPVYINKGVYNIDIHVAPPDVEARNEEKPQDLAPFTEGGATSSGQPPANEWQNQPLYVNHPRRRVLIP